MANIQSNLNKIKNAVLGVDVRDSIHDGIKAINEEVENTTDRQVQLEGTFDELVINAGNSNPEVAAARVDSTGKSHGTLGKRLNNFDSQIKEIVTKKIYQFDSVASMRSYNLKAGEVCETLGFYEKNDGGGSKYLVREKTDSENENPGFTFFNDNGTVCEKINGNTYNVLEFGLIKNSELNNSEILQNIINTISNDSKILFPEGEFIFENEITMKKGISIVGINTSKYYVNSDTSYLKFISNGFVSCDSNTFSNISIKGTSQTGNGITGKDSIVLNCTIEGFAKGLYLRSSNIEGCNIRNNSVGVTNLVDSKVTNCIINANKSHGIDLFKGCNDNIISNNKIEWNEGCGIQMYLAYHNVISNNVIDRSSLNGISISSCTHNIISDNLLRRNYNSTTEGNNNFCQIKIEGSSNLNVSGNIVRKGGNSDDASTAVIVPPYGMYICNSSKTYLLNNDTSDGGFISGISKYNNESTVVVLDYNNSIYMEREKFSPIVKYNDTINYGASKDFELEMSKPTTNSLPNEYKLEILYRAINNFTFGKITLNVLVGYEYSDLKIQLNGQYDAINLTSTIAIIINYNSITDKFYFHVDNTSSSTNYQFEIKQLQNI